MADLKDEAKADAKDEESLHPVAGNWALTDRKQREVAKKKGRRMPDPGPENYNIPKLEIQLQTSRKSLRDVEETIQQEVSTRRRYELAIQQSKQAEQQLRMGVTQLTMETDSLVALIKQCKKAQGIE